MSGDAIALCILGPATVIALVGMCMAIRPLPTRDESRADELRRWNDPRRNPFAGPARRRD